MSNNSTIQNQKKDGPKRQYSQYDLEKAYKDFQKKHYSTPICVEVIDIESISIKILAEWMISNKR